MAHPTRAELITLLENTDIRQEEGNALVYAIQSALSLLGYGEDLGNIDGYIGKRTQKALKNFQAQLNISASEMGKIGSPTLDGLVVALKKSEQHTASDMTA